MGLTPEDGQNRNAESADRQRPETAEADKNERIRKREVAKMSGIGTPGLIVILLVAILLFGPKKLPELGASIGKTLREFKKASREITEELQEGETVREK